MTDSQSVVKTLESIKINFRVVKECLQSLVTLAEDSRVTLKWVLPGTKEKRIGRIFR